VRVGTGVGDGGSGVGLISEYGGLVGTGEGVSVSVGVALGGTGDGGGVSDSSGTDNVAVTTSGVGGTRS